MTLLETRSLSHAFDGLRVLMDVVFSLADRITVLHHGTILATGTSDEIQQNHEVQAAYLGEMED